MSFVIKDSGKRIDYPSGMRRDIQDNKPNYALIPREFLLRWAWHMTKGAQKYGRDNWRRANSQEELDRFQDSAFRHFMQWLNGELDEDHAAAVAFNVAAAEYVKEKMKNANDNADKRSERVRTGLLGRIVGSRNRAHDKKGTR